jgi:hypothetical protein
VTAEKIITCLKKESLEENLQGPLICYRKEIFFILPNQAIPTVLEIVQKTIACCKERSHEKFQL